MINKVFLLGNLGSDPQVKFTKDGVMMVIFRVATNEFIRRNGTYEKVTDWHTVRVFGKLAEFCSKLKKGDRVFIEGKLKSSSFEIDNKIFKVSTVIAKSVKLIPQGITKEEIDIDRVEIYNNEDFGIEQEEELPF
ncbi:MAG: single-stranded DNA-binding protein [Candidatus Calescibacterium sp.]|jgi:single-strand DNA-binding protein|nr:single-stranded DNA-binding protein [Candidatus Calescibacterium sp.]